MIAKNRRQSVMGVKALLLQGMGRDLEQQWKNERDYTTNVARPAKAEDAFPDFIARKGRWPGSPPRSSPPARAGARCPPAAGPRRPSPPVRGSGRPSGPAP